MSKTRFASVWDAIEDTREAADDLRARAELMIAVSDYIRTYKLTQAKAAKQFGVTQPRISDLMRGKVNLFSIDKLIAMLTRIGARVQVKVDFKRAA